MHRLLVEVLPSGLIAVACVCGWTGDPVYAETLAQDDYLAHLTQGKCTACGQSLPAQGGVA